MVLVLLANARLLDRVDSERALQSEHISELNRDLEKRVLLRTTELASANAALQMEIGEHHRTEQQLHDIEQELRDKHLYTRSLIESSIDALGTIGPDGRIKDVNQQMEALTGYPRQELIGTPFRQYFSDAERAEAGLRLVLERGKVTDYELLVRHRSGTRTPVAYNASTFYNQQRELQGVFAAARDITDRKKLEQELREKHLYTRSLIESSIDALATISPDGRITDVNQQMEELTGYSRRELIGAAFRECFTDPERAEAGIRLVLETGRVTDYELIARHRNGRPTPVAYNAVTFYNQQHELQGVFAAARDIRERKRTEQALRLERQRFQDVLEILPAYVVLLTPDYHFALSNREFRKRFGDPEGRRCFEYLFGRTEPCENCESYKVLKTMEPHRWNWTGPDKREYEIIDFPFVDADGSRLILEMGTDVTDRKRAEESLRLQAEQYATMLATSVDGFWRFDLHGNLLDVNDTYCRMSGYTRDELLAMSIQQIEVLETPEQVAEHIRQVVQSGFDRFESQHCRKDGTVLDVEISVSFWRSAQQMILFVRDITDRKRAQQALRRSEERYRSLTIATAQIVWTTDREGQVVGEIAGWTAYTGMTTEEIQGWGWINAVHPEDRERTAALWSKAIQGRSLFQTEYRIVRPDGEYCQMVTRGVPVLEPDGSVREWIGTCSDVTEQKQAQLELARAHAELEDKVRERTADLAAANQELEAFTYSVSHDLRAPLRHVDGFAELLTKHLSSAADEQTAHYLTRIRNGAKRMSRLVEDLLNLSRIGRQEMHLESTPLNGILEGVIRELETGDRQIEWKLGPLPTVRCDAALIKQVFFNLLDNAVKFTAPRERAVIEVSQLAYDPSTIYVRDNGVGFDMKYADKLFGAFQRLHPPEQFPGTGVGLATVRRIVQKHGGQIWAEAAPDAGATFYFTVGPANSAANNSGSDYQCALTK